MTVLFNLMQMNLAISLIVRHANSIMRIMVVHMDILMLMNDLVLVLLLAINVSRRGMMVVHPWTIVVTVRIIRIHPSHFPSLILILLSLISWVMMPVRVVLALLPLAFDLSGTKTNQNDY